MSQPRLVARSDHYTEGVVVAPDGTLYYSMTAPGEIVRMRSDGAGSEVWAHVPAANGHAIDVDGTHVVMSSAGSILRLDASGCIVRVVACKVDGRWLTYPNDLALDTVRGGYYVTDSGYKETPKTVPADPQGRVYRVDPGGRIREVAGGLAYANGIAMSHDGSVLYVGESVTSKIWSYAVRGDGSLGPRRLFAEVSHVEGETTVPDGFVVGPGGRLYVAHYGAREVLEYTSDGALERRIPSGNTTTSHAAFSPDNRTLYVSGGIEDESGPGAIFAIEM
ncbi:MAG TPA: SMP-30/gluconolactonase/LRE family protein [Candidatus Baltobacteraceae bacterium]|nr:SMP-30/gluconolactonase/LRE family protein [Candidatus Baltobacteraceae bacterium]